MDIDETHAMLRAELATPRSAPVEATAGPRPARATFRLVAYVVDWLVVVIVGSVLVSIGGLQLYLASGRGRDDAPDAAIYAFLAISALVLPLWLVGTLAGWAAGRSVGKLALGLRIVDRRGRRPGLLRTVARLLVYALENVPLLLGLAVVAAWPAAGGEAPPWLLPAALLLLLAGVAALLPALRTLGGRPLHDIAAGTVVVEE